MSDAKTPITDRLEHEISIGKIWPAGVIEEIRQLELRLAAKTAEAGEMRKALEPFANAQLDASGSAAIIGFPGCKEVLQNARETLAKYPAP